MPSFPAGPRGLPIAGNVFDALRDPLELFMAGTRDYGDVVGYHMLHYEYVLLTNPEAIRHVLMIVGCSIHFPDFVEQTKRWRVRPSRDKLLGT